MKLHNSMLFLIMLVSASFSLTCSFENQYGRIDSDCLGMSLFGSYVQHMNITSKYNTLVNVSIEFEKPVNWYSFERKENGEWVNKLSYMRTDYYNGKYYYTFLNVPFVKDNKMEVRWSYDHSERSGKFNVLFWRGAYQNPIIYVELDPYWSMYNINNFAFVDKYVVGNVSSGIFASENGTILITSDDGDDKIRQFSLSSAWNLSTKTMVGEISGGGYCGVYVEELGTKMFVACSGLVKRYTMSTPWNISTAINDMNKSTYGVTGIFFSNDGTKMYVSDYVNKVIQYSLSQPWNISSAVNTNNYTSSEIGGVPQQLSGIHISSDGKKMILTSRIEGRLYQYTLSTPWNVSTATYDNKYLKTNGSTPDQMYINKLGTKILNPETISSYDIVYYKIDEFGSIVINNPKNDYPITTDYVQLNFTIPVKNLNYSIYKDDSLYKTVNITSDDYTYSEIITGITEGQHNITIVMDEIPEINKTIVYNASHYAIIDSGISDYYELTTLNIKTEVGHYPEYKTTSAYLTYNNTLYPMTVKIINSTIDELEATVITPLIKEGSSITIPWTILAINNNSENYTLDGNQTINYGYYISNVSTQATAISGSQITQNITVINTGLLALAIPYANSTSTGNIGGVQKTTGNTQTWTTTFNILTVTTKTNTTINNYLKIIYGGETIYRDYGNTTIEIIPIEVGLCGGNYTIMILNYSAWDEYNNTQITTNNNWITKIDATTINGTETSTIGINSTGALHQICIEPNSSYIMNVSTFLSNNYSKYVKRSHFILNQEMNNTTNNIKIYLMNISEASIIDFYVKNAFDKYQKDRIIRFYRFYPESSKYEEIFNLLTDINGHSVGYIKAYDQWYKLVVVDLNGEITKIVPSTQFSTATYTIIETSDISTNAPFGINYNYSWNNNSKILSVVLSSLNTNNYKLTLEEVGFYGNTTYCSTTGSGTSVIMFCDVSNSSLSDFRWTIWVERKDLIGDSKYYPIASGEVESEKTPPYGETGLILTVLITVMASLLFLRDTKIGIIMVMVSLTVCRAMQFIMISEMALISLWAVALVLVYIMRGDRGG